MAASRTMHRVLLLGSGRTCSPLIELLTREGDVSVTVGSNMRQQAQDLASAHRNTLATPLDVESERELNSVIRDHSLVISMVPNVLHPKVARCCIANGAHLLTTSYVSPDLAALDEPAKEAGVVLMNECGLDPGIDHMLAMECIDEAHDNDGEVTHFESWCGGLPHYNFADNPLKYKFSWSPLGVLTASYNPARYLSDGQIMTIPPGGAIFGVAQDMTGLISCPMPLEGYFNRDSVQYVDVYGIPEAQTVVRGTLRYKGYCQTMKILLELGLLSEDNDDILMPTAPKLSWIEFMDKMLSQHGARGSTVSDKLSQVLGGLEEKVHVVTELGLLSEDPISQQGTPRQALAAHLEKKLQLGEAEYDKVILQHRIRTKTSKATREEHCITLDMDGSPRGHTAMATLVGKPAAIVSRMILTGQVRGSGVMRPLSREVYKPALKALQQEGVKWTTTVSQI